MEKQQPAAWSMASGGGIDGPGDAAAAGSSCRPATVRHDHGVVNPVAVAANQCETDCARFQRLSAEELLTWLQDNHRALRLKDKTLHVVRLQSMTGQVFLDWSEDDMLKLGITTGQRKYVQKTQMRVRGRPASSNGGASCKRKQPSSIGVSIARGSERKRRKKRLSHHKECIGAASAAQIPWVDFLRDFVAGRRGTSAGRMALSSLLSHASRSLSDLLCHCEMFYQDDNSGSWNASVQHWRRLTKPGLFFTHNTTPEPLSDSALSILDEILTNPHVISAKGHVPICDCTKCTPNKNSLLCLVCKSFGDAWARHAAGGEVGVSLHFPTKGVFPVKRTNVRVATCRFLGFRKKHTPSASSKPVKKPSISSPSTLAPAATKASTKTQAMVPATSVLSNPPPGFYYDCYYNYNRTRYFKPTRCSLHTNAGTFYSRVLKSPAPGHEPRAGAFVFHLRDGASPCACLAAHDAALPPPVARAGASGAPPSLVSGKYAWFQYCSPDDRKHRKRIIKAFDAALGRYGGFLHVQQNGKRCLKQRQNQPQEHVESARPMVIQPPTHVVTRSLTSADAAAESTAIVRLGSSFQRLSIRSEDRKQLKINQRALESRHKSTVEPPLREDKRMDKSTGTACHFLYLPSNPLVHHHRTLDVKALPVHVQKLDTAREWAELKQSLRVAKKALNVRMTHATTSGFREAITLGCRVLHYTGHGLPDWLVFEDGLGRSHLLDSAELGKLFAAGNSCKSVRLVFVAACHSEASGEAFVGAGVRHVIAVRVSTRLRDRDAIIFTRSFYLALLVDGHTVQDAFDIAKEAVQSAPRMPSGASRSAFDRFLLLPKDANHRVRMFDDVPRGDIVDMTPASTPSNAPAPPPALLGRNDEVQAVVQRLIRGDRLVNVTGPHGIGKTSVVAAACQYLCERRAFPGGIWFLDAARVASENQSGRSSAFAVALAKAMSPTAPVPTSIASFAHLIRRKHALFVVDGVDSAVRICKQGAVSITDFITGLLSGCPCASVLTTSEKPLRTLLLSTHGLPEVVIKVPSLHRAHLLKLLLATSRPISATELSQTAKRQRVEAKQVQNVPKPHTQERLFELLGAHPIVRACRGSPHAVWRAAHLLHYHRLGEVSELLMATPAGPPPGRDLMVRSQSLKMTRSPTDRDEFNSFWKTTRPLWSSDEAPSRLADFCLQVQRHFGCRTGAQRAFSWDDILLIARSVGASDGWVHRADACQWWGKWYRPICSLVTRVVSLWDSAPGGPVLIRGVSASKRTVEMRLRGCPPGTFELRLSARHAGHLALGFIVEPGVTYHILIKCEPRRGFTVEMGSKLVRYARLDDFVRDFCSLKFVYPDIDKDSVFSASPQPGRGSPDGSTTKALLDAETCGDVE